MGSKPPASPPVEPIAKPSRQPQPEPEAKVEQPQVEQPEAPKPEAKPPGYNPKALINKQAHQRHPITATIPVYKREALIASGAEVTADRELNPDTIKVSVGSESSFLCEWGADMMLESEEALALMQSIVNSDNPREALKGAFLAYKQAQRTTDLEEQMARDLAEAPNAA
jgi:hypothetical protein